MPRTQLPKIDGLKVEGLERLGRPVIFELTVDPGQDVVAKLLEVWEASDHSSYIISVSGHISKAAIGKPSSDMFCIYDGHFQILSLSGHWGLNEEDGSAEYYLCITLADSDGEVFDGEAFGGTTISRLIASDTVELLMINFVKEEEKSTEKNCDEAGTSAKASSDSAEKENTTTADVLASLLASLLLLLFLAFYCLKGLPSYI